MIVKYYVVYVAYILCTRTVELYHIVTQEHFMQRYNVFQMEFTVDSCQDITETLRMIVNTCL